MIRKTTLLIIKIYRLFISPLLGNRCCFYPSCSLYAQLAIERYGFFCGAWLVIRRLLKCHPWYKREGYDPVPEVVTRNYEYRDSL